MKILFYGAGVIGSLYAARLHEAGQEVSILARGRRLKEIREYGVVLEQALTGEQTTTPVNVVEQLSPEDAYDLIVVAMRKNQVPAVLPILWANQHTPTVLFMVNNSSGYDDWIQAVGRDRLLLGFPSAAGSLAGHIVRYTVVSGLIQPMQLGEPDGRISSRLRNIVRLFKQAGFPTAISRNMDAWQKTHVALISPIANALYRAHLRSFGFYEKMLGSVYSKCHGLFKQSDRFRMGNHRASVVGGVASEEEDSSPGLELSRPDGRHLLSPQEWMQLGGLAQRFAPLLNGLLALQTVAGRRDA